MRFILRSLLASGGALSEDETRRLVTPGSLNRVRTAIDDDQDAKGPAKIFKDSLAVLSGLKLVTQNPVGDRTIKIDSRVSDKFNDWSELTAKDFSDFLSNEIFSPSQKLEKGDNDLYDAVSFVMFVSDPLSGFSTFDGKQGRKFQEIQFKELGDLKNWVVKNTERYQSLRRWLTYLGIARILQNGIMIIEPSTRIEQEVLAIVEKQIPIDHLLDRLGEVLPFTDRGWGGTLIKSQMVTKFDPNAVSPGLSVGLEVLEGQGKVRLLNLDDAVSFAFQSSSDSIKKYSHIAPAGTQ